MNIVRKEFLTTVYEFKHVPSGQCYVGSTAEPFSRFGQHIRQLSDHRHVNSRLQDVWDRSHISDWTFRILERVPSDKQLMTESVWIQRLQPFFNIKQLSLSELGRQAKIERVVELRQQGMKYRDIARVNCMSLGWVCYVLKRYKAE